MNCNSLSARLLSTSEITYCNASIWRCIFDKQCICPPEIVTNDNNLFKELMNKWVSHRLSSRLVLISATLNLLRMRFCVFPHSKLHFDWTKTTMRPYPSSQFLGNDGIQYYSVRQPYPLFDLPIFNLTKNAFIFSMTLSRSYKSYTNNGQGVVSVWYFSTRLLCVLFKRCFDKLLLSWPNMGSGRTISGKMVTMAYRAVELYTNSGITL